MATTQEMRDPQKHSDAEYFTLLSGHQIPAVGLGTWRSGSDARKAVFAAIVLVIHLSLHSVVWVGVFVPLGINRVYERLMCSCICM
jgi:hypothetical protein